MFAMWMHLALLVDIISHVMLRDLNDASFATYQKLLVVGHPMAVLSQLGWSSRLLEYLYVRISEDVF